VSNTITVTSGTGVLVVSDTLRELVRVLSTAAHELELQHGVLGGLLDAWALARGSAAGLGGSVGLPESAISAQHCMSGALQLLGLAWSQAARLESLLHAALVTYEAVDAVVTTGWHDIQEQNAWGLGVVARIFAVPLFVNVAATVLVVQGITGLTPAQQAQRMGAYFRANPGLITNERFVALVRSIVSNLDGFAVGFAGLPPAVESVLGAGGVGALGLPSSAAGLAAAGSAFGLFRETGVRVTKVMSQDGGSAPGGLSERLERIPNPAEDVGGAQIRIDRYTLPGLPDHFDVYLAGTVTFDPKATTEPFDLTSDVAGVAQDSPGAARAVAEAMRAAGITSKSPVVFNGYSEGGLIATLLASSGHYNVKGLVTFGAPAGQVRIAAAIPVLTVRNTDDLVPATGGYDINPHAVIVERSAFDGHNIPNDLAVPAHRLPAYRVTAALADQSKNESLTSLLTPLDRFGGSGAARTTLWRAVRDDGGVVAGGVSRVERAGGGG
jgi:hypothetical protein